MSNFINATIDDHKFDALIEVMNDHAVHLKPVLAAIGNLAVKSVKQNFREGGRPNRVLSRLIKSPYKIYFLNIPYFMRVR